MDAIRKQKYDALIRWISEDVSHCEAPRGPDSAWERHELALRILDGKEADPRNRTMTVGGIPSIGFMRHS